MNIEKNGTVFAVTECNSFWKVENTTGKLSVCYKLSKKDYSTFEDVRLYVLASDVF